MSKFIVAKITEVFPIEGADNIQAARVCGENVVVSKDAKVGDVGIFFPVDTQVSEEYAHNNNLFRHSHLNADNTKSGFFEDNRRVKAVTLRKVKSCGYFAEIESIRYTRYQLSFALGETFDELNGKPICNKYVSQATRDAIANAAKQGKKLVKKLETPFFEKHVDSAQFKHNASMIPVGSLIHFHHKVHGTSHRSGLTMVKHTLPKWKQIINKLAPIFPTESWDYVVGTRNVILTPGKEGFHGSEQFRFDVAEMLKPFMEKGMTIYGEIAGYANGKPIMAVHNGKDVKDKAFLKKFGEQIVYKYGCAEHEYRFHIYRITQLNHAGVNVDYTEAQLEQWCAERQLNGPMNVREPMIYDGDLEWLMSLVEQYTENAYHDGQDYLDPTHPGEGIILRIDTGKANPYFLKSKAHNFRVMEGMCEAVDAEDVAALSEGE
ncbi:MAG: hypothetical protein ACXW1D_00235 [Halobacteriota archaeon]